MIVYMLRDNDTGLFYRRNKDYAVRWVEQKNASVWTSKAGPISAWKGDRENTEIVPMN